MLQLLFLALLAFLLMEKIGPLRELVMKGLDQVKPATVKTIAVTMSVIFLSNFYNILKIQNKCAKLGTMTPMDQVLWRTHLLEASLMGFSLFLLFLIDRRHHYLKKLFGVRGIIGASKKEEKATEETKRLQTEISNLTENLKKLKLESKEKDKRVETAKAHVNSLQKQSADLLDRLLEDNQNLQAQALRI